MFTVYTDIDAIPSTIEFVHDSEAYFVLCDFSKTLFNETILVELEDGTYLNNNYFIDRFGSKLSVDSLSTSSKILANLGYFRDTKCFNISELGYNALGLISMLDNCIVYMSSSYAEAFSDIMYDTHKPYIIIGKDGIEYDRSNA